MIIDDAIYGRSDVGEKAVAELIASPPMQRIKLISQQGIPNDAIKQAIPYYSRYDHCVGVMLLLRKLGAPFEEQVAGLLHDVSHSAFSHVVDYVMGSVETEDYQDKMHRSFIMGTELKGILESHGLDPERIADLEAFPLLERHTPMLCADRVDYCMRDLHYYYKEYDVSGMIGSLRSHDNEIVFSSKEQAFAFGKGYMHCQEDIWGSDVRKAEYAVLSAAIRMGLSDGIITKEDLFSGGDLEVMDKLESGNNAEINKRIRALRKGIKYTISETGATQLRKKLRYVDPKYFEDGKLLKLSETDSQFRELLDAEKRRTARKVLVDVALD